MLGMAIGSIGACPTTDIIRITLCIGGTMTAITLKISTYRVPVRRILIGTNRGAYLTITVTIKELATIISIICTIGIPDRVKYYIPILIHMVSVVFNSSTIRDSIVMTL
jgi:hypothetical protein